ncbi:MAG TPA: PLP-dependent transferase, partial [Planctomycetota bacterium]|nr:PLP-dependent transferase [Planctomycetota bacterium]
ECWSEQPQVYARYGTETTRALIGRIRALEHARAVTLTDCGMQACALLFDVLVTPRSHAIIGRQTYNKTKKYLERLARLVNGSYTIVDDGDYDAISAAIRDETVVVFFETFTNPLVRALDPSRLGSIVVDARKRGARSLRAVIDSTIATPWSLKKPLLETEGIDFVVASGTKALGGADRDLWGYIASNEVDTLNEIMDLQAMRGGLLDWRRGRAILEGLDGARERFERRSANASRIADFLARHPRVAEVFHPSLASHADRAVIERAYRLPGSLLSFRVDGADEDATRHFSDVLVMTGVPRYALSFDGLTTKVNHHVSVSEYFTPREELERAGIDRIVRIGVGLEEPDDVIACLNWALWRF